MRRTGRGARRRRPGAWLAGAGLATVVLGAGVWLALSRADGPWGMLPGGPFRAPAEPCTTERLAALAPVREVALEVHPQRPRSVTTWSVVVDGAFHVPADFLTPWKRWPQQVLADPRVRLRADGRVLECRATRVEDAARIDALRRAIARKYDLDPHGRAARAEVWWFRLGPRTGEAAREEEEDGSGSGG